MEGHMGGMGTGRSMGIGRGIGIGVDRVAYAPAE
jgi:hypothetical protein